MKLLLIKLPVKQEVNGEIFEAESTFQLNLEPRGEKIDVHFWKPSIQENGKHFLTIKACSS